MRIYCQALGLNPLSRFLIRGGTDYINIPLQCIIKSKIGFLDSDRLRKIIHYFYHSKRKG